MVINNLVSLSRNQMYLYFIMGGRTGSAGSGYGGADHLIWISYIDVGMFAEIVSLKGKENM